MTTPYSSLARTIVGTVAAGAIALSAASPAMARPGERHGDRDGVDAGDVIAGALIIGGIAAIAAAADDDRDDRYDRDYRYDRAGYDDGWRRGPAWRGGISPRRAVEQCVWAAERRASGYSYGAADVTDIRSVRETRWGYEVRGRIAVNAMGRDWRRGDARYGRGWDGDYRGWNSGLRGYDAGRFECRIERGRVVDIDYSGIRGLR